MGNIVLLDELTINKIAAGEVIERPASVVKEMVENSIDAGATNINIEIRNGGISYIRISDNGKGIAKDDMEIAFERHATSKIRSAGDLNLVKTMGFRGEALASIAAIANVEMISKTATGETGNRIVVEAGKVLSEEETGCPQGTTITVQNLFFNTPVRYKFLKKDYTESGYIEDTITRLALVNPEIAFKLINSGKTILQTSGNGNLQDVIYAIYGGDIASSVVLVDYSYEDIHITGVVGKPEIARSNRSNQTFFVNKRFVKDKTLSGATENSFKGLLPIGKYGFLILNLEIDPAKVDVNVHPAKLEVRFEEENKVFKAVYHAIKDTLLKAELIANTEKTPEITRYEDNVSPNHNTKSSITDLFRKIKKEDKVEEVHNEVNVIEDIFQKREIKEQEKQNSEEKKMDVFKELMAMQKRLKEEAQNDASLKTNIDKLITDTQKMGLVEDEEGNVVLSKDNSQTQSLEKEQSSEGEEKAQSQNGQMQNENGDIEQNKVKQLEEINKGILNETTIDMPSVDTVIGNIKYDNKMVIKPETSLKQKNEPTDLMEKKEGPQNLVLREDSEEYKAFSFKYDDEQPNNETSKNDIDFNNEAGKGNTTFNDEMNKKEANLQNDIDKKEQTNPFSSSEIQEMIEKLEKMDDVQNNPEFENMYEKIFGKLPASTIEEQNKEKEKISAYELIKEDNKISMFDETEELKKPTYKFVGIAFRTYIIIEIEKELYIIDQHAAHERVMYEKVKKNYYSDGIKESQMLLLPDVITLTHKEMDILRDNAEMFGNAGFAFEEFGENTIKLMGVPNICIDLDTKELFMETLDEINTVARTAKQEIEEKFIATVACKAAVKAHMDLTEEEVDSLMSELLELPNPFTCPHGRPTAIRMDKDDIEKKFARRK